ETEVNQTPSGLTSGIMTDSSQTEKLSTSCHQTIERPEKENSATNGTKNSPQSKDKMVETEVVQIENLPVVVRTSRNGYVEYVTLD
ncbi:hypothetical protein RYX45_23375, partial [Alkalihalophilus pseudofirmus]